MAFDKANQQNPTVAFFNPIPLDGNDVQHPGKIKGIPIKGNSAFEKAVIAQAKANPDFELRCIIKVHILDENATSDFVFDTPAVEATATPVVEATPAPVAATPAVEESIPF